MSRTKGDRTLHIQLIPTQKALTEAQLRKKFSLTVQPYQLALQVKGAC